MLTGFHVPLTPRGLSTLNPAPPWHYSGDFVSVEFWAQPGVVSTYLPAGLQPDDEAGGRATAFFLDWEFSGDLDEFLDPARYQYREFFLLLDARHEGTPVSYCPYMFVDNDAALARGWSQGYPKRLGTVHQTRWHAARSKAAPQLEPGSRFAASASAGGQRLADAVVTLRRPASALPQALQRPVVNLLHVPHLSVDRNAGPVTHELVMNVPHDLVVEQLWEGDGELSLPLVQHEEVSDLAPLRVGGGARGSLSYIVDDLTYLGTPTT